MTYVTDSGEVHEVGTMTGWFTRGGDFGRLENAGDTMSAHASWLAWVAEEIIFSNDVDLIETVLMIDRTTLVEPWRGNKLTGLILENIVDLLELHPL